MIVVGTLLIAFWGIHKFLYHRSLSLSQVQTARILGIEPTTNPLPIHIFIAWNSDVGIEPMALSNREWGVSNTKAAFLLGSARPGESGNIIIYGHNKREILGNIRALKGGEHITIHTNDGKDHIYVVADTHEVSPDNTLLLSASKTEVLTLYTCSGLLDSMRFIVRAVPLR